MSDNLGPLSSSDLPLGTTDDKIELMVTIHGVDRSIMRPKQSPLKCYAVITVNNRCEKTHVAERSRAPTWDIDFIFHVSRNEVAEISVELFAKHRLRKDNSLGKFPPISYHCNQSSPDLREITGPSGALKITVRAVDPGAGVRELVERTTAHLTVPTDVPDLDQVVSTGRTAIEDAEAAVDVWKPLLDKINKFSEIMVEVSKVMDTASEVHPYAKAAWRVLSGVYKIYQHQRTLDLNVRTLLDSLSSLFDIVDDLEARKDNPGELCKQNDLLLRIAKQTIECCYFVRSYMTPGLVERTVKAVFDRVPEQLKKFNEAIIMLKEEYDTGKAQNTNIVVIRTLVAVENLNNLIVLEQLEYDKHASMGSSKGCLPGTRITMLDTMSSWINSDEPDTSRVAVLLGGAGMGKSSIIHTVAHQFKGLGRLAASFVFDRSQKDRGAASLFPTVARHFADLDDAMKAALISAIADDTQLRTSKDLKDQFEHLILRPFQSLTYSGPLLIAIDALDECPGDLGQLIEFLFHRSQALPTNIRILVTSRPEHPILESIWPDGQPLADTASQGVLRFDLSSIESTTSDICLYIESRLEKKPQRLFPGSPEQRRNAAIALAEKSTPSFQFAAVACNTIMLQPKATAVKAEDLYNSILSLGKVGEKGLLDPLYQQVLRHALMGEDGEISPEDLETFKLLMAVMLNLVEPMSLRAYRGILLDDNRDASGILSYLGSVLKGVDREDRSIRPAHTSFYDFLVVESRSGIFFVDPSASSQARIHTLIAHGALVTMHHSEFQIVPHPIFDPFEVTDYGLLPDSNVGVGEGPHEFVFIDDGSEDFTLAYHTYYWCHWVTHFLAAEKSPELLHDFETFVVKDTLRWIEALAHIYLLEVARDALFRLFEWYTKATSQIFVSHSSEIVHILRDAHRLVCEYADALHEDPLRLSSIVLFTPSDTLIERYYASAAVRVLSERAWSMSLVLDGHHDWVNCVRFSPDGRYIVSGGGDGMIETWDTASGASLMTVLISDDKVTSVSWFEEEDTLLVVSGYRTGAIRVWNALSGTVIRTMQAGNPIGAVAYSLAGKKLFSVSCGSNRLDIWDSSTGTRIESVSLQLEVASDIRRAAFSADGTMVVTVHEDHSLRIWDSRSGAVLQTLSGHEDTVNDAVFTVDGKRVISGGMDRTVRAWGVDTGELLQTMRGHNYEVVAVAASAVHIASADRLRGILLWSVDSYDRLTTTAPHHFKTIVSLSFSPDGTQLASGSQDGIVRVWNPFIAASPAHTKTVTCLAFSADGELIASGSGDKTIIIWETRTGKLVHRLKGHKDWLTSVAFFSYQQRLVSVAYDGLVCVWDIKTGELMQRLRAHTTQILALAVSHDGELVATGSPDGTIRLWEMTVGNLEHIRKIKVEPLGYSFTFSPDRQLLVSDGYGGQISTWDVETLIAAQRSEDASGSIHSEGDESGHESAEEEANPRVDVDVDDVYQLAGRKRPLSRGAWQDEKWNRGWIIDRRYNRKVCWLPRAKEHSKFCVNGVVTYGEFCAIGSRSGQVTILRVSGFIDTPSPPTASEDR